MRACHRLHFLLCAWKVIFTVFVLAFGVPSPAHGLTGEGGAQDQQTADAIDADTTDPFNKHEATHRCINNLTFRSISLTEWLRLGTYAMACKADGPKEQKINAYPYTPSSFPVRNSISLVWDYLTKISNTGEPKEINEKELKDALSNEKFHLKLEFDFLIATVPSPEYGFDTHVDGIKKAAATLGYKQESYFYPWRSEVAQTTESKSAEGKSGGDRPASEQPDPQRHPGLLLFRGPSNPMANNPSAGVDVAKKDDYKKSQTDNNVMRRPLLVYLIGETPTGGIHRQAFRAALMEIDFLRRAQPYSSQTDQLTTEPSKNQPSASMQNKSEQSRLPSIRILGPTFSSSRTSLAQSIIESNDLSYQYEIVTGRASSNKNKEILERLLSMAKGFSYKTVIPSSQEQIQAMIKFLCEHDKNLGTAKRPEIALLIESSSNLGQDLISDVIDEKMEFNCNLEGKTDRSVKLLVLPYELHISDIRHAQESLLQRSDRDSATHSIARASFSTARSVADVPPALSYNGLLSEQRALSSLLKTIALEQIWYVGIVALSNEDRYFLAQEVQQFVSGVQLFTIDADENDAAPERLATTRGMFTVSSYPVFPKTQLWTFPFSGNVRRQHFTRSRDIGVYNAFIILMKGESKYLVDYGYPLDVDTIKPVPSVWISQVTGEGIVPIQAVKLYSIEQIFPEPFKEPIKYFLTLINKITGASSAFTQEQIFPEFCDDSIKKINAKANSEDLTYRGVLHSGAFDILIIFLLFLTSLTVLSYFAHRFFSGSTENWLLRLFSSYSLPAAPEKDSWPRRLYRLVFFSPMAFGLAILSAISCQLTKRDDAAIGDLNDYYVMLLGIMDTALRVISFLLLWICVDILINANRLANKEEYFHSRLRRFCVFIKEAWNPIVFTTPIALSLGFGFYYLIIKNVLITELQGHSENAVQALLFLERSTNLNYGTSILVPTLCVFLLLISWAAASSHRARLSERMRQDFGTVDEDDPDQLSDILSLLGDTAQTHNLRGHRFSIQTDRIWRWCIFLTTIILVGFFVFAELVVYEKQWWGYLLTFGFSISFALLAVEFTRFVSIALRFQDSLRQMGSSPLLSAFARLPPPFARHLGIQITEGLETDVEHSMLRHHWQLLVKHYYRIKENYSSHQYLGEQARRLFSTTDSAKQLELFSPDKQGQADTSSMKDLSGAMNKRLELITKLHGLLNANPCINFGAQADTPRESEASSPSYVDGVALVAGFLKIVDDERPLIAPMTQKEDRLDSEKIQSIGTGTVLTQRLPDALHVWLRLAEDLVAIQRVVFIHRIFAALRTGLIFVLFGLVLLLLAFNLYPFQPYRLMMSALWSVTLCVLPITLWIFIRLDRDEVLSYIAHSKPGEVTFSGHFISRLVTYIFLPLATFFVSQFPTLRAIFLDWIEPTLRALR